MSTKCKGKCLSKNGGKIRKICERARRARFLSIGDFAEGARKPPKKGEGLPENFHSALNDYPAYFPRGNGEIPAPALEGLRK